MPLFIILVVMTGLIYWRHRSNIVEIIAGTEDKIVEKGNKVTEDIAEEIEKIEIDEIVDDMD